MRAPRSGVSRNPDRSPEDANLQSSAVGRHGQTPETKSPSGVTISRAATQYAGPASDASLSLNVGGTETAIMFCGERMEAVGSTVQ
jgi:hypothetical protein